MLPCPFHAITGLDCPFCGMQRAVVAVCEGRFSDAFWLNPVVWLLLPIFVATVCVTFRKSWSASALGMLLISNKTICVEAVVLLVWGIVRNL